MIDKLAEFCGIKRPGKPIEIPLVDCTYTLNDTAIYWNPLEDERHCRDVLEWFYRTANWRQKRAFLDELAEMSGDHPEIATWAEFLLLATPAEKCRAVLRVLGASGAVEALDK